MEFYDGMINELIKFNDFVHRVIKDDFSLASVYGIEKTVFIFNTISQCKN